MQSISEQTVREIAVANPASARVFETLGIDYCCGGNRSLRIACEQAGVPLETITVLLETCEPTEEFDVPNDAGLGELTRHIVERHHGFVRRESPRIDGLLVKVCGKHGSAHPELHEVKALFTALAEELGLHMMKEERILFPYIEGLETPAQPAACFGSVESPIAAMVADHENAGAILAKIRARSNGFEPPEGACPTYKVLYQALMEFERDLHWHVHLENNILFPRAIAAERNRPNAVATVN